MPIRHIFTSPKADDPDPTLVRPSDWNSAHAYTLVDGLAAGTQTASSGTVAFSNSNGITFGMSGSSQITASYTVPTVTNSSWTVSDNATSGTVARLAFTNQNGVTLSLSTGAGGSHTIVGSHNALTSQSNQNVTAGNGGFAFQTLSFSNANNFSFGTSAGSAITGSYTVPTVTNSSWTVSDSATSATVGRLAFTASNGLTLTLSTSNNGNHTVIGSYTVPTVPAQFSGGLSNVGNTSGDTVVVTGRVVLAGGNNITVSGSSNGGSLTITISGANAGGAQTGISGIQVSDTTYTSGTVTFRNANGISFGSSGANGVSASYTVPTQSNQTVGVYGSSQTTGSASSGTYDARSISIIGAGIISVGNHSTSAGGTTTGVIISATQSNQAVSAQGGSSAFQTLIFTNSNNVSFSNTGGSVWGSFALNVSATGGTSNALSGLTFKDSQGVSFGLSTGAGVGTITASVAAQSTQSAIKAFGASNTGNTAGNTGVSTGIDWVIAGTNNITVSESTAAGGPNTLWISAPNAGGGGQFSAGASNLGNTAGSTGITGTRLILVGTNAVSLSQSTDANGGTLSINVNAQTNQSGNVYGLGNTTGTSSGTYDARTLSINVSGALSVAASNSGWNLSVPATSSLSGTGGFQISTNGSTISLGDPAMMELAPFPPLSQVSNSTLGQNTLYFVPFDLYQPVSAYRVNFFVLVSTQVSALNSTGTAQYIFSAALYTRGTGASTERISSLWSGSWYMSLSNSSNSNISVTHPQGISNSTAVSTGGSNQNNVNATTYLASSVAGQRVVPLPISSTLTPGRYWLCVANSNTGNSTGSFNINASVLQQNVPIGPAFRPFGTSSAASNASYYQFLPGAGTYSATSGAFPGSVALTTDAIRNSGGISYTVPSFQFSGYTTGTNVL